MMDRLERLIEIYETNEDMTIDKVLDTVREQDPEYGLMPREEGIELQRRFLDYVRDAEELRDLEDRIDDNRLKEAEDLYQETSLSEAVRTEDRRCQCRWEELRQNLARPRNRRRAHKRYSEAFVNNISVPKTLEELDKYYLDGNSAQKLVKWISQDDDVNWTVPRWVKRGDIVLFMHSKTARSTLTRLRTEVRSGFSPQSPKAQQLLKSIDEQLDFHKKYGGKIYAVGRICGRPSTEKTVPGMHYKSRTYCDIDDLFLLEKPVDISEFNSFIRISRQSGITPVFGAPYDEIKRLILQKNHVPEYFGYSVSTPFPHALVNNENWMRLGLEYRRSFTLEIQFRQCYVDYLLKEIGDQKTIYKECPCYKNSAPVTFVDNVIRIGRRLLPVEVKLNIELETALESQCEQYCMLDRLVLSKNNVRGAKMENVVNDRVLVIDTYAVYMFYLKDRKVRPLYDLQSLKTRDDIHEVRRIVLKQLEQ